MALSFDGTGNKLTLDISDLDLTAATDHDFSLNFKIKLADTTSNYTRCIQVMQGGRGFLVVQKNDKLFVIGSGSSTITWGRDSDTSCSLVALGLSAGVVYNITASFANLSPKFVPSLWVDGVPVTAVGDSSNGGNAEGYGAGDDTNQVTFGSRCKIGSATQSESNVVLSEFTMWQGRTLLTADAVAMTGGDSGDTFYTGEIAKHYRGLDNTDTAETGSDPDGVATFYGTVATSTPHPTINGSGSAVTVSPASGTVSFTGQAPTVAISAAQTVLPLNASIAFTGYAPSITTNAALTISSNDFDSALFDPVGSSVANATTLTPTVTLAPDDQADVTGWLMLCARMSNTSGKTPTFTYSSLNARTRLYHTQKPVWKYLTDGRDQWKAFDNVSDVGDVVTVSNNTAFTGDIEFASKPRWHYSDTQDWITELDANGNVHELASSVAASGLPKHVHAQTDPGATNANSFPQQLINLYGVRITNDAANPVAGNKWPIVLLASVHSSEDQGNWMLQHYVDYLLGGSPTANGLLRDFEFYLYDVNPAGRAYGKERFTEGDGNNTDANRAWDGNPAGTVVAQIITAIGADVTGMKGLIDWHGAYTLGSNTKPESFGSFYNPLETESQTFYTKMAAKMPGQYRNLGDAGLDAGIASVWSATQGSLINITHEGSYYPAGYPANDAMYDGQAIAVAETLSEIYSAAAAGVVSPGSGSITLTGQAPTVTASNHQAVTPANDSITITGQAPVVVIGSNQVVQPANDSIAITGNAPTVVASNHQTVAPANATLTITGQAPAVSVGNEQIVQPGSASVIITGQAPTVAVTNNVTVAVQAGTVTFTGLAPTLLATNPITVNTLTGLITLTGYAPNVAILNPTPTPARRTYTVGAESRVYIVPAESRVYQVK